ncbi:13972_t:CDS:1, partial [Gigaspora rosea]
QNKAINTNLEKLLFEIPEMKEKKSYKEAVFISERKIQKEDLQN